MLDSTEPSTMSHEREERIAARRARIARNREKTLGDDGEGGDRGRKRAEQDKTEFVKAKSQIGDSKQRLEKIKAAGVENVTSIRVSGDDRENSRRINEEARRQERRHKLLHEAEQSAKRNAAVAMKWSHVMQKEIPQQLYQEMMAQKEACDRIIASKDRLIKEFQAELKAKDDEYVKALKKQAEDIDILLDRMGKQFVELQKSYEEELEEIENTFMQERQELLEANRGDTETLFAKRRDMEAQFMEQRQKRVEDHAAQLEQLRVQDAEEYNILKVKLETEIQTLEQQLEEMRATYQLNTERLEYNYRVLSEREIENSKTISQQKRKISRLQDMLSGLMARYKKSDRQYRQENADLTDEYRRITEQFKDLQSKFRHFQQSDRHKYNEIWSMNEEIVCDYVGKVLESDKIIHEQQLGLNWFPPSEDLFNLDMDEEPTDTPSAQKLEVEEEKDEQSVLQSNSEHVKKMLEMLCDEAGFLVEGKVRQILDTLPKEEQNVLKVDSILKGLGVRTAEDVEMLLRYFMKESGDLIHANDAIQAIKAFVEDHSHQTATKKRTIKVTTNNGVKETIRQREKEFWERMAHVISDKTFRVWKSLDQSLHKYNVELRERQKEVNSVAGLRRQNHELKQLLNQYLTAKVNDELHVPPAEVIRFESSHH
eukprot:Rmarinus@m.9693